MNWFCSTLQPSSSISPLLSLPLVNLFKQHLHPHAGPWGHVVMLLCYLNVRQNVRAMAECEPTTGFTLLVSHLD